MDIKSELDDTGLNLSLFILYGSLFFSFHRLSGLDIQSILTTPMSSIWREILSWELDVEWLTVGREHIF